ncbi:uncharacterized protein FOMMEDRAFT_97080 [Fomitiporia mediterranea MF3/22]|uniref:uncharacterized protein n=1 Tax=Fomitiporia mediterranea (strain MF3/22) TaxID=694068 RepID=UPI0004408F2E|nr:uncharacterized protein FOMMEDRAFT_97080 [Fomitiporia mediterranea MF3/22]EJC98270.1 hypothetical protein FOMMEDRAFT_97080 [Fomitiporia mediterranea MF3/22]
MEADNDSESERISVPPVPESPDPGIVVAFDPELSSLSPQPSLFSLSDSIKERAVYCEHGRRVNSHSNVYKFPSDEEEHQRQDKWHRLLKVLAGEYVPPFYEVLADDHDSSNPKTCLDLGCGSGTWLLEVASAFPHVCCTAVDLVPLPASARIPPNFRFEIDDISLGLEHFAGQFDVVHVRCLSPGIKDYYRLIDDTVLALRSCGLAEFLEFDLRVFDIEKRVLVPTMPVPFSARIIALIRQAMFKRGSHVDAASLLHLWISEHCSFEDVVYRDIWIPCGDWLRDEDAWGHPAFSTMSSDDLENLRWSFMESARPLLLSTGVPEELVSSLIGQASQELREACIPLFICAHNVYARKKER